MVPFFKNLGSGHDLWSRWLVTVTVTIVTRLWLWSRAMVPFIGHGHGHGHDRDQALAPVTAPFFRSWSRLRFFGSVGTVTVTGAGS